VLTAQSDTSNFPT